LAVLDPRLKFAYFIPHQPQELSDASPFGFYTPGMHESQAMLISACTLPADVRESFTSRETVLQFRLLRALWRYVVPIDIRSLQALAGDGLEPLFRVVLTNSAIVADTVDSLRFADGVPFLHASAIPAANRLSPEELHGDGLQAFVESVLTHLDRSPQWQGFIQWVREAMPVKERRTEILLPKGSSAHNVTLPNECALTSFGWVFKREDPLVPFGDRPPEPKDYIERICSLADTVSAKRAELMQRGSLPASLCDWSYIVTAPSIHWGHYKTWRERAERLADRNLAAAKAVYEATVKQSTYFDQFNAPDNASHRELQNDPGFRALWGTRAADQRCYTAGLSLLASSTLAPVLRLEPKINQVRGELRMLAICARTGRGGSPQLKQSRLARAIGTRMRELVDPAFLTRIEEGAVTDTQQGLKLVADAPLEWLSIADLPLMLRYDVSRIPVLPGNLYIQHCVRPPVLLSVGQFAEVLVVRSFDPNDPRKFVLEAAVRGVFKSAGLETPRVTFRDVSNVEQLTDAINEYKGAVLVFDCHGSYEDIHGVGSIVVGGRPVEVWNLHNRCQLPPIVIFSACDTHPIDGGHGSSANAAFVLGATSVLGTLLPIDARMAALFIGRLLLRISEFIPIALKERSILTWREVISGMIRMSYTSEVRRVLTQQAGLRFPHGGHERTQFVANTAINERQTDWFEQFAVAIAREVGRSKSQTMNDIVRWASLTDALKYVQLGSPENIVILPDVGPKEMENLRAD